MKTHWERWEDGPKDWQEEEDEYGHWIETNDHLEERRYQEINLNRRLTLGFGLAFFLQSVIVGLLRAYDII